MAVKKKNGNAIKIFASENSDTHVKLFKDKLEKN